MSYLTQSKLLRAILVFALPLCTLLLISWTTLDVFPKGVNEPLQEWCLVHLDTSEAARQGSCTIATHPNTPPLTVKILADPTNKSEKTTAVEAKASPPVNEWQFRAAEADARYGFAIASSITRIVAVTAILSCLFMLTFPPTPNPTVRDGWVLPVAGFAAAVVGAIVGVVELHRPGARLAFVNSIFEHAVSVLGPSASTLADANSTVGHNLIVGYAAVGVLLTMLASLAFGNGHAPARLTHLQIGLFFGAALFTSSVAASNALVTWAEVFLDPTIGVNAKKLLERIPVYWGVSGSALLIVATGLSYLSIREGMIPSAPGGSVLAFRTADDQDFKVLGWLINILLALAPAWTALKGAGALPPFPV